ncbi:MAG: class I SAM-dependent methyltransferase [Iphinoe sp. HA4291-MV1]|jgi:predicted O-methyltransferase YrrM|nr:class I SAM-dependent methyltransferase [Iphinoe sp. HA4291-MV1]
MNQLLEEIYSTKSVKDMEGNSINPFPTATPYDIGIVLKNFIQKYNLERTLEVGMAYGLSTLFICQAHQDKGTGIHTAIDPMQNSMWKSIGLLNVKKANLADNLRFFESCSHEVLPQLLAKREKLDFAFIDGSHHFDYTLVDFFYIDKLLQVGGYVVFDDIWMPGVRKVVSYVLRNRDYELVKIDMKTSIWKGLAKSTKRFLQNPLEQDYGRIRFIFSNICVLRKISEDNRNWDYHRSF